MYKLSIIKVIIVETHASLLMLVQLDMHVLASVLRQFWGNSQNQNLEKLAYNLHPDFGPILKLHWWSDSHTSHGCYARICCTYRRAEWGAGAVWGALWGAVWGAVWGTGYRTSVWGATRSVLTAAWATCGRWRAERSVCGRWRPEQSMSVVARSTCGGMYVSVARWEVGKAYRQTCT